MSSHGKKSSVTWSVVASLLGWACLLAAEQIAVELPPAADIKVDFQRQIQPLLEARCHSCHGAQQQLGGLRLDSREVVWFAKTSFAADLLGLSLKTSWCDHPFQCG